MTSNCLSIYTKKEASSITVLRDGETKVGQSIRLIDGTPGKLSEVLEKQSRSDVRYAILGIPEDIGVRANFGRGGCDGAWSAFLEYFLNTQSNQFLDPKHILLLGNIVVEDLMLQAAKLNPSKSDELTSLRALVDTLDTRVCQVVQEIAACGIQPIVIGGGHNNSYPIIKGVGQGLRTRKDKVARLNCINCDAHADFRTLEGRHSGNGFSYAHRDGYLSEYYILGLAEAYNNQDLLDRLAKAGFRYRTYEEIFVRGVMTFREAIIEAIKAVSQHPAWVGIELDLDSIGGMPSSAESPCGITNEDANIYINYIVQHCETAYLHLPEGAPKLAENGGRLVGKALAGMVRTYLCASERKRA